MANKYDITINEGPVSYHGEVLQKRLEELEGSSGGEGGGSGVLVLTYGETVDLQAVMKALQDKVPVFCMVTQGGDGFTTLPLVLLGDGFLFSGAISVNGNTGLYVATYVPNAPTPWSINAVMLQPNNLVTSISAQSTDAQYPSAKCVYDAIDNAVGDIESALATIIGNGGSPQVI